MKRELVRIDGVPSLQYWRHRVPATCLWRVQSWASLRFWAVRADAAGRTWFLPLPERIERPLAALVMEQWQIVVPGEAPPELARMYGSGPQAQDRCGTCDACRHVEATKKILLAPPPLRHMAVSPGGQVYCAAPKSDAERDRESRLWNQTLEENPCERWVAPFAFGDTAPLAGEEGGPRA